jgi:quercetin dioxygenase-like cupin family protein
MTVLTSKRGVPRGTLIATMSHECDFQIVIMTKGWARFMDEDKPTLGQAGDVVHQRPGIVHYLYDYSPDMAYLEIVSPGPQHPRHAAGDGRCATCDALEVARRCHRRRN